MRSPQMAGVEPLQDGSFTFQFTFSVSDHFSGRPVESDVPLSDGPRHCGQFSPPSAAPERRRERRRVVANLLMMNSSFRDAKERLVGSDENLAVGDRRRD